MNTPTHARKLAKQSSIRNVRKRRNRSEINVRARRAEAVIKKHKIDDCKKRGDCVHAKAAAAVSKVSADETELVCRREEAKVQRKSDRDGDCHHEFEDVPSVGF